MMKSTSTGKSIPIYQLDDPFDTGVLVYNFSDEHFEDRMLHVHRDEHYLFICIREGDARFMVDFDEYQLTKGNIFCILPGQVHQGLSSRKLKGIGMAASVSVVPKAVRSLLEQSIAGFKPVAAGADELRRISDSIELLETLKATRDKSTVQMQIIKNSAAVVAGLFAQPYERMAVTQNKPAGRDHSITQAFRTLLGKHWQTHKAPAFYAAALHIGVPYLNQAVKRATGLPVSHWIQAEIIMEAKRMLFHTNLTSKEIAYQLGFEDHAYFSRFFTGKAGLTPLAFRNSRRQ